MMDSTLTVNGEAVGPAPVTFIYNTNFSITATFTMARPSLFKCNVRHEELNSQDLVAIIVESLDP